MKLSEWRGHQIEENEDSKTGWAYSDTKEPCTVVRECGLCELENTPEGHDGCIGTLPDVMNACCGHGKTAYAYVHFGGEDVIRGQKALDYIEKNNS